MLIRPAGPQDHAGIVAAILPAIRAGETYTLPPDLGEAEVLTYWLSADREVFVAVAGGEVLGTSYLKANQQGGGSHVANAGYIVAPHAAGRGIARQLCLHSMARARGRGFAAMQFNFVVASNAAAIHLWQSCGFAIVGTIPAGFRHPRFGLIDVHVMHRML